MPARAPASMLMLQMVMRPSIESARMAEPAYSTTQPGGAIGADLADDGEDDVLCGDAGAEACLRRRCGRSLAFDCGRVCVASTCSTSLVPMPKASAPNAPCVEVCESPQTMVMPGLVMPSSGPMTWTMPCSRRVHVVELDAEVGAVFAQRGRSASRQSGRRC